MPHADFYSGLPAMTRFGDVADMDRYHPVPADWVVATTDIVSSTQAIADGRYKLVNTAGASGISAVANALGHRVFPFVFGGDGAALAVSGEFESKVVKALAAVQVWAREELGLELRAAITPVAELRRRGVDVRIARYTPTPDVAYAMFAGGGVSLAEQLMKQGSNLIEAAAPGTRPDLTGLSCRWHPVRASNGVVASLLVAPDPANPADDGFLQLVRDVLALAGSDGDQVHPLPPAGARLPWPPRGLAIELAASARGLARLPRLAAILGEQAIGWISDRTGISFGRFNAQRYRRETAANSDFRKFDDGLKLTLDLSAERLAAIVARLDRAEADGLCVYGVHSQSSALMTCIVPSPVTSDHIHFIDGANGGYVQAAIMLKGKLANARKD